MEKFISCDWGTSAFRLRLIETETQKVLAEVKTAQGIATTYTLWKDSTADRFDFYCSILSSNINTLQHKCGYSLTNLTLVISGMASSGVGMLELNYKELPFKTNGTDLSIKTVEQSDYFKHKMIIVSGVKSIIDVIRGEETILIGCDVPEDNEEQLYIFPGTHSKHILVQKGLVNDFKTYMTGEFFDLLSTKSILSTSVEKGNNVKNNEADLHFEKGVIEGSSGNLLNSTFYIRTNQLLKKIKPTENYHNLSGLLIGSELKDLVNKNYTRIILVSAETLGRRYLQALQILSIKNVQHINAHQALIKGQCIILKQHHY
jgi:2-dehydro-3-deoxygalactonokinase